MSSVKDYFYTKVGEKIRKYRKEHGLTQEKLSEILNKNSKYIGHVERYERDISLKVLIEIIDLLKIQPSELFSFDEPYHWE